MRYFRNAYNFADQIKLEKYNAYTECVNSLSDSLILENGECIKDCNFLLNEDVYNSCFQDKDLIKEHCLLEGAKLDMKLKNFLKEGKDYKDLKKNIKELVKAYDLDDEELASEKNKFLHICKRILQVLLDIEAALIAGGTTALEIDGLFFVSKNIATIGITGVATNFLIGGIFIAIIGFIYYFVNRLLRILIDVVEFNTIKKDTNLIIDQLETNAKKTKDKKLKKEYEEKAEELKKKLRKYENKSNF